MSTNNPKNREPKALPTSIQARIRSAGAPALSNVELLALFIQEGSYDQTAFRVAEQLIERFGSLKDISTAGYTALSRIRTIGPARATKILAAAELGRRLTAGVKEGPYSVVSPEDAAALLMPRTYGLKQEQFIGLFLDTRKIVLSIETVTIGTLDSSLVHPRELFREAIRLAAASVIVAHNHPSGDPSPSPEDKAVTKRLVEAGKIVGIPVVDHIILGDERWISLSRIGLM